MSWRIVCAVKPAIYFYISYRFSPLVVCSSSRRICCFLLSLWCIPSSPGTISLFLTVEPRGLSLPTSFRASSGLASYFLIHTWPQEKNSRSVATSLSLLSAFFNQFLSKLLYSFVVPYSLFCYSRYCHARASVLFLWGRSSALSSPILFVFLSTSVGHCSCPWVLPYSLTF